MFKYIAKFIELAHLGDDYVAINMSIRGKIVGFLLQDMNSMVMMAMAIEREIKDARSI